MALDNERMIEDESQPSEAAQLSKRIEALGIDPEETEKVVEQAVLLFGEGRPEHEVEKIITDFYQVEADKIKTAEDEADRRAA